ncbi:MAG: HAD family hydrolase [Deltaproteobacteria bacterium]|nr:HAD family hydrolase [Deltaproteobacteria bacterium]
MIRAVSFDLDGTLYDDARARPRLLWATFPRWRALRVGRRAREELRGRDFADGEALLAAEAALCAERLERPADVVRAQLRDLFDVRLASVLARTGPRRGARALLVELAGRGLALAVVSDRGAVREKLAALGLLDLPWGALVSADGVGALKPSPTLFRRAATALGVAPGELLHVGDRDDTDGAGARAAGCAAAILGTTTLPTLDAVRRLVVS